MTQEAGKADRTKSKSGDDANGGAAPEAYAW